MDYRWRLRPLSFVGDYWFRYDKTGIIDRLAVVINKTDYYTKIAGSVLSLLKERGEAWWDSPENIYSEYSVIK